MFACLALRSCCHLALARFCSKAHDTVRETRLTKMSSVCCVLSESCAQALVVSFLLPAAVSSFHPTLPSRLPKPPFGLQFNLSYIRTPLRITPSSRFLFHRCPLVSLPRSLALCAVLSFWFLPLSVPFSLPSAPPGLSLPSPTSRSCFPFVFPVRVPPTAAAAG